MTALLEKAISQTLTLPENAQDKVAQAILEMLEAEDDRLWDAQFAQSQDVLALLAEEALEDYHAGRTTRIP